MLLRNLAPIACMIALAASTASAQQGATSAQASRVTPHPIATNPLAGREANLLQNLNRIGNTWGWANKLSQARAEAERVAKSELADKPVGTAVVISTRLPGVDSEAIDRLDPGAHPAPDIDPQSVMVGSGEGPDDAIVEAFGSPSIGPDGAPLRLDVATKGPSGVQMVRVTVDAVSAAMSASLARQAAQAEQDQHAAEMRVAAAQAEQEAQTKREREAREEAAKAEAKRNVEAAKRREEEQKALAEQRRREAKEADDRRREFVERRERASRCAGDATAGCARARAEFTDSFNEAARRAATGYQAQPIDGAPPDPCMQCSASSLLDDASVSTEFELRANASIQKLRSDPRTRGFFDQLADPLQTGVLVNGRVVRVTPER